MLWFLQVYQPEVEGVKESMLTRLLAWPMVMGYLSKHLENETTITMKETHAVVTNPIKERTE